MISSGCAMNMLGPCLVQSEQEAAALILRELDLYRGRTPVFLIPVDCQNLVRWTYDLGARNCELHFCQVTWAISAVPWHQHAFIPSGNGLKP